MEEKNRMKDGSDPDATINEMRTLYKDSKLPDRRQKTPELLKWFPVIALIVAWVAGFAELKSDVKYIKATHEKDVVNYKEWKQEVNARILRIESRQ